MNDNERFSLVFSKNDPRILMQSFISIPIIISEYINFNSIIFLKF